MRSVPITTTRVGQFDVIRPLGALDMATSPRLRALMGALCGEPNRHVVVDLSGVDFIDCTAIGALIFGRARAERAHGSLRAAQASPLVLQVMEITGVAKALGADQPLAEVVRCAPPCAGAERGEQAAEVLLRVLYQLPPDAPERSPLREVVVELTLPFALALARRFRDRGQAREDLDQVATVGLLKAVDRYDPTVGEDFAAYAAPTILGEMRRHFRDKGWYVHVPRRLQELRMRIRTAQPELAQYLGRSPTVDDLAAHLRVDAADILAALEATRAYAPRSLSAPVSSSDGAGLEELIGDLDPGIGAVEDRETLGPALARLSEREQRILALRFYGNLTQAEIGARLRISQMHVSRLLSRSLRELRRYLEDVADG